MAPRTPPAQSVMNPILLWILIHGGDPAPDAKTSRLSAAIAINSLAQNLGASARKEVRQVIGKEIAEAAGALGK